MKPEYYREPEYNENKEINSRKSQPSGNKKLKLEPIQQTGNFKKFTRVFSPLERSETYRGVEQPEPEVGFSFLRGGWRAVIWAGFDCDVGVRAGQLQSKLFPEH